MEKKIWYEIKKCTCYEELINAEKIFGIKLLEEATLKQGLFSDYEKEHIFICKLLEIERSVKFPVTEKMYQKVLGVAEVSVAFPTADGGWVRRSGESVAIEPSRHH